MEMERQKLQLEREKHALAKRESQGAAQAQAHADLQPRLDALHQGLEEMRRMHSAPVEIVRDPKTGKAIGARRVVN
jgi:hypothetical protein